MHTAGFFKDNILSSPNKGMAAVQTPFEYPEDYMLCFRICLLLLVGILQLQASRQGLLTTFVILVRKCKPECLLIVFTFRLLSSRTKDHYAVKRRSPRLCTSLLMFTQHTKQKTKNRYRHAHTNTQLYLVHAAKGTPAL